MPKKHLAILAIPILIIVLSCKPKTEPTATDTGSTGAVTTATTATVAPPPVAHEIDHYKFWKIKPIQFQRDVKLQGQFDKGMTWAAQASTIEYLGNPVEKNGEPILKPDWHLVGYRLAAPPQPARSAVIENQFRKGETLKLADAAWLLLPASKSLDGQPPDPPKDADHYVCYTVAPADPVTTPVKLVDQFDRKRGDAETIVRLTAELFCVPVSKDGGPIHKPNEHLTIYRLEPPDLYPISATTRDQFGQRKLEVVQSEFLAVPTTKVSWQ